MALAAVSGSSAVENFTWLFAFVGIGIFAMARMRARTRGRHVPRRGTPAKASDVFSACETPLDWLRLVGKEAPSPVWAAVMRGTFVGPERLTSEEREIWKRVVAHEPASYPPREVVFCVGRRGLKTTTAAILLVHHVLFVEHGAEALAGSELTFPVVSPSKKQARSALASIKLVLESLAALGVRFEERVTEESTELAIVAPPSTTTRKIVVFAASDRTTRGFAAPSVVIDEAGHFAPEVDRELGPALAGATLQFSRAMSLRVGTPGAVGSSFETAVTKPSTNTLVVRGASFDLNPRITREQAWQLAETESPANPQRFFDQEILAKRFGAVAEDFVSSDDVTRCVDPARDRRPRPAHVATAADLALTGRDSTALVNAMRITNEKVTGSHPVDEVVVLEVIEMRGKPGAPLQLAHVLDEAARLARRWPSPEGAPSEVRLDAHLASEAIRGLGERGIRAVQVQMHPAAQERRWTLLASLVRSGRLHLPHHPELLRQLSQLRVTQLSSGAHKVEGRRDDLADALALAVERALELPASDARGVRKVFVPTGERTSLPIPMMRAQWVDDDGLPATPPIESPEFAQALRNARATGCWGGDLLRWAEREMKVRALPNVDAVVDEVLGERGGGSINGRRQVW